MIPETAGVALPAPAAADWIERHFALSARGSNLRTEVLAGATTFITMAYIILVNPMILSSAGVPLAAAAIATCIAAGIASVLMGLVANVPLAMAPGMGLNAYFSYTVVQQMHVPWPVALGCVFVSGFAFLLLTAVGVRQMIVAAIPAPLYAAVAAGIGLFIGFIGFKNAGIVVSDPATIVALGKLSAPTPALALLGLTIMAALALRKVSGAILVGIVVTAVLAWVSGAAPLKPMSFGIGALGQTALHLDLGGVFGFSGRKGLGLFEILFVFLFVDLLDNIGTLVAVTKRAGLMQPDGTIPALNRILSTDSIATMIGAMLGTSTVTSYVESAAGVQVGGRTGLTAITTGILFLAAVFFAPYAQLIPVAATAPALIIVGALMMAPLSEIEWSDPLAAIPSFLTIAAIPLTFSIANGIALGITAYAVLKLLAGQAARGDTLLFVLAALFIVRFAWLAGS